MNSPIVTPAAPAAHSVAEWLLSLIDRLLNAIGLETHEKTEEAICLFIIIAGAFLIGWMLQKIIYFVLRHAVKLRPSAIGQELLKGKTLARCCYIIPPLVVLALAPFALEESHSTYTVVVRIAGIYALFALAVGLGAVFTFIFNYYNTYENKRKLPLKGLVNVAIGVVWIIIVILSVSVALDKSPGLLLTGLGAFAAALMLVFKDSILGFVAGIQLSENDMIHVGDWIVVPDTIANGVVLDMTLTTVKVQNWDNTIVTLPPYSLVQSSFQNWRGMSESGCRRIVKNLTIDITSVKSITPDEADTLAVRYPLLKEFVDNLRKNNGLEQNNPGLTPINGTIETNLGLFRAYCCLYIYNNPFINNVQQILVRILDPTNGGLPLQVYCFTATTDWNKYEGIQSAIIEHISTVCGDFGLDIYSSSTLTVSEDNGKSGGTQSETKNDTSLNA